MAEKEKGPSKLPFGMSPITLAALFIGLIAVAVVYLPGLFGGGTEVTPGQITRPKSGQAMVTAQAGSTGPGAAKGQEKAESKEEKGKPAVQDDLATFLVSFGRANPFAPFEKSSARPASSTANVTTASQQPLLTDLRQRLESLQGGTSEGSAAVPPGKEGERFVLTGIVRYESLTLAVIVEGAKPYYAMVGEPLGKTGYILKSIREDSVVIASGEDEKVLALRRKSP